MKARLLAYSRGIVLIAACYVGTYLLASLNGEYEQVLTESNYKNQNDFVEAVGWQPCILGRANGFNDLIVMVYWPLSRLDREYWHPSDMTNAFSRKYRVDPVLDLKMRQL